VGHDPNSGRQFERSSREVGLDLTGGDGSAKKKKRKEKKRKEKQQVGGALLTDRN